MCSCSSPYRECLDYDPGGFLGALADDFLEVKTDVILNEMIPSEQRATLISVGSFMFSIVMIFLSTFMGWMLS